MTTWTRSCRSVPGRELLTSVKARFGVAPSRKSGQKALRRKENRVYFLFAAISAGSGLAGPADLNLKEQYTLVTPLLIGSCSPFDMKGRGGGLLILWVSGESHAVGDVGKSQVSPASARVHLVELRNCA